MGILTRAVAALALQVAVAMSAVAADQAYLWDLEGVWQGLYIYPSAAQRPVPFTMTVRVNGDVCRGRIEEPNTFGHPSAPLLYANVQCQLVVGTGPPRLLFRKVYDGTGGQSHSVDYEGEMASDRNGITGTWRIGTQSGRFSLIRQ
jgi:hypothetical protein